MTITAEWAGVIVSAVAILGAVFLWVIAMYIKPLSDVIKENAQAYGRLCTSLALIDSRVNKIEILHELRGCGEGSRNEN